MNNACPSCKQYGLRRMYSNRVLGKVKQVGVANIQYLLAKMQMCADLWEYKYEGATLSAFRIFSND